MALEARSSTAPAPVTVGRRLAPILPAIGIALLAFAWLRHVTPPFTVTDDGVRDQLLVRDCTDLGHCHLVGPRASFGELHHGAAWLDLLVAVRLLGGDVASQQTAVLALLALGVATVFVVVWRWLGSRWRWRRSRVW